MPIIYKIQKLRNNLNIPNFRVRCQCRVWHFKYAAVFDS